MKIPFNKPHYTGDEILHLTQAAVIGKLSGNGSYTNKCHSFFEETYGMTKTLLTTSCSDALEMAALLCNLKPGDEVIMPSFTFVSTANAFALRGAKIVFVDSRVDNPNIDADQIEGVITDKTRVIVAMHYAGIACDMDPIMELAEKYKLIVVEDAAQALDAYYKNRHLGNLGSFGAYSFHETKNISSGEGGMIAVNDPSKIQDAEIMWEKGTNRAAFTRGDVQKYEWVSLGSSFLPNELTAAFLYAQLVHIQEIQNKRLEIWQSYYDKLEAAGLKKYVTLPVVPDYARHNGHLFYITVESEEIRNELLNYLNSKDIQAVFHYLALHTSPYYRNHNGNISLPNAERFSSTLLRLPFYYSLTDEEITSVVEAIGSFFMNKIL